MSSSSAVTGTAAATAFVSSGEQFQVEQFDVDLVRFQARLVRRVILRNVDTTTPALAAHQFERGQFYSTGSQLGVCYPSDTNSSTLSRVRLFSAVDGSCIADAVKISSMPLNAALTYDALNNLLWSFGAAPGQVSMFKNVGPMSANYEQLSTEAVQQGVAASFSPESILSIQRRSPTSVNTTPLASASNCDAAETILLLLANVDRLARHHPIYGDQLWYPMVEPVPSSNASSRADNTYCLPLDDAVVGLYCDMLDHSLRSTTAFDPKARTYVTV
jgi:hypothetical protein